MKKEASFYQKKENNLVLCNLCSHNCKINDGNTGICNVRKNEDGKLYSLIYGTCSSMAKDPIEKKPLYHFHPGTYAFSFGTVGCNFKCLHCQNYSISTALPNTYITKEISPEDTVNFTKTNDCQGIAYTYNEPTIWHEFNYDSAKLAKKNNLYTVYVSNGYISEDAFREISNVLDAINIDVKAFNDKFYKKICKASLNPVLETCELAKKLNIHLELTYLVIPDHNDSADEINNFLNWVIDNLGKDTPIHFSRFHPDHNLLGVPVTPMKTLYDIWNLCKEKGLLYVYLGNVTHGEYGNTQCPKCKSTVIQRNGYLIDLSGLDKDKCRFCKTKLPIIY